MPTNKQASVSTQYRQDYAISKWTVLLYIQQPTILQRYVFLECNLHSLTKKKHPSANKQLSWQLHYLHPLKYIYSFQSISHEMVQDNPNVLIPYTFKLFRNALHRRAKHRAKELLLIFILSLELMTASMSSWGSLLSWRSHLSCQFLDIWQKLYCIGSNYSPFNMYGVDWIQSKGSSQCGWVFYKPLHQRWSFSDEIFRKGFVLSDSFITGQADKCSSQRKWGLDQNSILTGTTGGGSAILTKKWEWVAADISALVIQDTILQTQCRAQLLRISSYYLSGGLMSGPCE
jgi:hypothetical protein